MHTCNQTITYWEFVQWWAKSDMDLLGYKHFDVLLVGDGAKNQRGNLAQV